MALPPLNLAPPDLGEFPEIRFNPGAPGTPGTPGGGSGDPGLDLRGAIRTQIRE